MTQQEKQILLVDLGARLAYKPNVYIRGFIQSQPLHWSYLSTDSDWELPKPYLRPMSSMTEEEKQELQELTGTDEISFYGFGFRGLLGGCFGMMWDDCSEIVDWLNAHHFDYRGLIEKGLALPAPDGMYR